MNAAVKLLNSDKDLADQLAKVEDDIKNLTFQKKRIVAEIIERNQGQLDALLKAKDEPYGDVSTDFFKVSYPKKVEWDQRILASLANEIAEAGSYVSDYIKVTYEIAESKWKAWPTEIRAQFEKARTVSRGNPSVKVKEEKDE